MDECRREFESGNGDTVKMNMWFVEGDKDKIPSQTTFAFLFALELKTLTQSYRGFLTQSAEATVKKRSRKSKARVWSTKRLQIIDERGKSDVSAWTKAPADVAAIADKLGFERVAAGRFWLGQQAFLKRVLRKLRLQRLFERMCWKLEQLSLKLRFGRDGGELLLQHPLPGSWMFDERNIDDIASLKEKGVKITVLVHDVGALRGSAKEVGGGGDNHTKEMKLFSIADKLIVHNEQMAAYIKNLGVQGHIVPLRIFDYLVRPETTYHRIDGIKGRNHVLFVGGFGAGKARFVQELKTITQIDWTLYGHDFNPETMGAENVHYLGKFDASCPPVDCGCSFGLVWDGDSAKTCTGPTGEYLRVNNPHKLSLYLAMGLPVIVWEEAAVAAFVVKHGCGIAVDSLREIPAVLDTLDAAAYDQLADNARHIAEKLRAGDFTKAALIG